MKSFGEYQEDSGGAGGAAVVGAASTGSVTGGVSGAGDNPDKTVPVSKKKQKQYIGAVSEQKDPDSIEQTSKHKATPPSVRQRLIRHKIANERETEHSLRKRASIVSNIPNIGTVPSSKSTPRRITGAVNMESFAEFHKKSKIKPGSGVGPQNFMTKENWAVMKGTEVISTHDSKDKADVKAMKHPLYKVKSLNEKTHIAEMGGDQHYGDAKGATSGGGKGKPITHAKMASGALAGLEKELKATRQTSKSVADARSRYGIKEGTVAHQMLTTKQNATTSKNPTGFVKVGDSGHLGFGTKGGAGFTGVVSKIEGDMVHMTSKYNKNKTYRGHVSKFTKD